MMTLIWENHQKMFKAKARPSPIKWKIEIRDRATSTTIAKTLGYPKILKKKWFRKGTNLVP